MFWDVSLLCHALFAGIKHPTLPQSFGSRQGAVADTRPDAGNGSKLFEVSPCMRQYGRGQPKLVSVGEAEARRKERASEARRQGAETLKRRMAERWDDFYERQQLPGRPGE